VHLSNNIHTVKEDLLETEETFAASVAGSLQGLGEGGGCF
jgi:hypothetical protein